MASSKEIRLKRKVRRSYTISTISIALVLYLLGVVSYVTLSALSVATSLRENVTLSVELANELDEAGRKAVLEAMEATACVASVEMLSKDAKLNDEAFRKQFELDIDELLGENPLRDSYEVTLKGECSTGEAIDGFVRSIEGIAGVEYIAIPPIDVVESMQKMITHASIGMLIFFGVLLIISVLLLNNTIRLAIYSKRYLINTFKLVGATKWYIMRPLLGDAIKQGFVAGIIAAALVCLTIYGVESFTPQGIVLLPYREVAIVVGAMVALGVVITLLFSAMAVNKFVNMKSNKIYLY